MPETPEKPEKEEWPPQRPGEGGRYVKPDGYWESGADGMVIIEEYAEEDPRPEAPIGPSKGP